MSEETGVVADRETALPASRFPDERAFQGLNRPGRVECDVVCLEVEGTLPADLDGALYRCGPDPQFPPRVAGDLYINGDGMVSLLRIADGQVDLRMRYVRTDKFLAERAARRALFGHYRNPFTDDPSVAGVDRTTANTAIAFHAGRLFALKEDGLPHELDPVTLETRGKWNGAGALRSRTFTAHPKLDPVTGELVFFGYAARGDEIAPDLALGSIGPDGALRYERWIVPPYQSMIHDWGVTQSHVVLPVMGLTTDEERLRAGGPRWLWDDTQPTYVLVIPRGGGPEDVQIFEGPPCWSFHTLNAFDDGDRIHLDLNVAQAPPLPDIHGNPPDFERTDHYLTRWTFDRAKGGGEFQSRRLWDEMATDFTDPDPRRLTLPYRYGFMAAKDRRRPINPKLAVGVFFNSVARIDHETGEVDSWYAGDDIAVQEPMYVPRSDGASEGDGYVLTIANHEPEKAELLVLDAGDLPGGPIARVRIPVFQRPTFHSAWVRGAPRATAQRAQTTERTAG